MDERTRVAFEFAFKTTEHLITISTGVIALSITFLKDFVGEVESRTIRTLALVSWLFFLLSVSCGLITFLQLTGNLGNPDVPAPTIYTQSIQMFSIAQIVFFLLGLGVAVGFGALAARAIRLKKVAAAEGNGKQPTVNSQQSTGDGEDVAVDS